MKNITFETNLGKKYSVKTERIIDEGNGYVITRGSSYGAEILCTKKIMIIDIDYKASVKNEEHILSIIQKCNEFIEDNVECNLRLYRTAGGMRVLISGPNDVINVIDDNTVQVMESFDADSRYSMLCDQQGCYRARLTPKPKRVGLNNVKCFLNKYGLFDIGEEVVSEKLEKYYEVIEKYKTCELILKLECNKYSSDIIDIIQLHDNKTKANAEGLILA